MATLPISVVCFRCMTRFDAAFLIEETPDGDVAEDTTIERCKAQCPTCGGLATVPDGKYSFERLAREAIARATERERRQLAETLGGFDPGDDVEVLLDAIGKLSGPWTAVLSVLRSIDYREVARSKGLGNLLSLLNLLARLLG